MNYIFFTILLLSILAGFINGTLSDVVAAMLEGCNTAVKVAISLIGIMSFWLGIMRIAEKSGLINILSKLIYPIVKPLFKDIPKNSPILGDITMSLGANSLGLTNAATPIGLKVMKELQELNSNKETASDSMCMFLGMNTAGFQIIPATVIGVLTGLGATNPTDIILPTLIVTTISFITAVFVAFVLSKIWKKEGI
jgi:spore maturation protein A